MFEAALLWNIAQGVFTLLVLIIGWLIRDALTLQKSMHEKMAAKLDLILVQVNATNGRVGKLEVRADHVERGVVRVDHSLTTWAKDVTERVNTFIDRHNGGSSL